MGYTVREIADWIEEWADPSWAESYDNCGFLIGHEDQKVDTVVTALDVTEGAVDYALGVGAQMIISHHPVIFHPFKRIVDSDRDGARLLKIIEGKLAVCAAHTSMDAARGGTNDIAAKRLGLLAVRPLCPIQEEEGVGMGRIGTLPTIMTMYKFAEYVKQAFTVEHVRLVCQDPSDPVHQVALCTGRGMSFFAEAVKQGADVYLTGDVTYHEAEAAVSGRTGIVDAGHFATELPIAEAMAGYLQQQDEKLKVYPYTEAEDPFHTI
ncbi:MAG: Nif3-like dinuclear metal center hexameric protein [Lachnospirales bacterium]